MKEEGDQDKHFHYLLLVSYFEEQKQPQIGVPSEAEVSAVAAVVVDSAEVAAEH